MAAPIDFNVLQKAYFQFDKPVDYKIDGGDTVLIYPISLMDSELFINSMDVISIEKDEIPDPSVISMSYLEFLIKCVLTEQIFADKLAIILKLSLHWDSIELYQSKRGTYYIGNPDFGIRIPAKQFNDIRRIILYQNIIGYDDSYINPELKKAMAETDALKGRNIEFPNTERRMAIITSHTGIPRSVQSSMTYREHMLLFREVSGEADFMASWPIILYAGEMDKHEHWIYKKKKGKFDDYITNRDEFAGKLGVNPDQIKRGSDDNSFDSMFDNFKK